MTLLSWNSHLGRGTADALGLAEEIGADAVLLQEAQSSGLWGGHLTGSHVAEQAWGSWVLVRDGEIEPIDVAGYSGWVSGGRWAGSKTGYRDLYLFSLHTPTASKSEPRGRYVAEARNIVTAICASVPAEAPLVIGGDFNFTSFGVRLSSESIRNTRAEIDAITEFRQAGLSIAWRDAHPDLPLPQTLRWKANATAPYHCDGFLTRGLGSSTVECEVITTAPGAAHSDHNPVRLVVAPTAG